MIGYGIIMFAMLKIILRLFYYIKEVYKATFFSIRSDFSLRICFKKIEKESDAFCLLKAYSLVVI